MDTPRGRCGFCVLLILSLSGVARAQAQPASTIKLADIRMRDVCILPDPNSRTYYMIGSGRRSVRAYTSTDLASWRGPQTIFSPANGSRIISRSQDVGMGCFFLTMLVFSVIQLRLFKSGTVGA